MIVRIWFRHLYKIHLKVCVKWRIHTCDITPSYVWHDSLTRSYARLVYMHHMICLYVRHASFILVTRLIHTSDVTHSYAPLVLFIWVTWLIHMCDTTHAYEWHDSSKRFKTVSACVYLSIWDELWSPPQNLKMWCRKKHMHVCICGHTHVYTSTRRRIHVHTITHHTQIQIQKYVFTDIFRDRHTLKIDFCIHAHTDRHTCTHMHAHTHAHSHTHKQHNTHTQTNT